MTKVAEGRMMSPTRIKIRLPSMMGEAIVRETEPKPETNQQDGSTQ